MNFSARRLWMAAVALCALAPGAPLPREGTIDATDCFVGRLLPLRHSENHSAAAWEMTGARRASTAGSAFDGTSARCVGLAWVFEGRFRGEGVCEFTDGDGDRALVKQQRDRDTLTWAFVSGTGKFAGITGEGVYDSPDLFPSVAENVYQQCPHAVGRYRLPKPRD